MWDELSRIRGYFPRSRKQGKYRIVVSDMMEDPLGNQVPITLFYTNAANRIEGTKILNRVSAMLPDYKGMKITVQPVRQEADSTFMGVSAINLQRPGG